YLIKIDYTFVIFKIHFRVSTVTRRNNQHSESLVQNVRSTCQIESSSCINHKIISSEIKIIIQLMTSIQIKSYWNLLPNGITIICRTNTFVNQQHIGFIHRIGESS